MFSTYIVNFPFSMFHFNLLFPLLCPCPNFVTTSSLGSSARFSLHVLLHIRGYLLASVVGTHNNGAWTQGNIYVIEKKWRKWEIYFTVRKWDGDWWIFCFSEKCSLHNYMREKCHRMYNLSFEFSVYRFCPRKLEHIWSHSSRLFFTGSARSTLRPHLPEIAITTLQFLWDCGCFLLSFPLYIWFCLFYFLLRNKASLAQQ